MVIFTLTQIVSWPRGRNTRNTRNTRGWSGRQRISEFPDISRNLRAACLRHIIFMPLSKKFRTIIAVAAAGVPLLLFAAEKVDLSVINRIKTEAFENSKVMDHMFYLTDVNGPRLTGSPNYNADHYSRPPLYGCRVD